ncbi:PspC domain-containing protein [Cellulomonas marina]|uniref:Phage shock protein PspC (Stress-responsive transcriptional regulator) n=1 Tax=Cellulomonas marina TaxID=988821 RepID=A0A1I1A4N4_9CELL|nr:PspC domain-containing protein [Cellulomonas marina]GIG30291.1 hypothetical protein Cma02nite_28910 [Cellulomonas marina]SFB31373.1 Phage shock protein PspC (stress-responsive transcriptional regulator) [Cellulomonas marina]
MDTQTSTGEQRSDAPRPAREGGFFAALRRSGVTRADDRWVGGVAAGTADRFGIDPLLVRGLLAVSVLLGGLGLVAYAVAWLLLPERSDGRIHLEELLAGRFDVAVVGAGALLLSGLVRGDAWWMGNGDAHVLRAIGWVAFVGLVVWVVVTVLRRPGGTSRPGGVPGGPPPAAWAAAPGPYGPFPPAPGAAGAGSGPTGTAVLVVPPAPTATATGTTTGPTPPAPQGHDDPVTGAGAEPGAASPGGGWSGGGWSGAGWSGTGGPGQGWTPPPARAPRPPRPPRRGPAAGVVGVVVALSIIGLAVLLLVERSGRLAWPVGLTAAGGALVLVGAGIVVSGLQGRSSGWLGFLGIVTGLVAVPAAIGWSSGPWDGPDRRVADQQIAWTERSQARAGLEAGLGDVRLDLTQVPLTGGTLVVPVDVGAGGVEIVVPEGADVSADLENGLGTIRWDVAGVIEERNGAGTTLSASTPGVADGDDAQLHLVVQLGLGDLTVEEE